MKIRLFIYVSFVLAFVYTLFEETQIFKFSSTYYIQLDRCIPGVGAGWYEYRPDENEYAQYSCDVDCKKCVEIRQLSPDLHSTNIFDELFPTRPYSISYLGIIDHENLKSRKIGSNNSISMVHFFQTDANENSQNDCDIENGVYLVQEDVIRDGICYLNKHYEGSMMCRCLTNEENSDAVECEQHYSFDCSDGFPILFRPNEYCVSTNLHNVFGLPSKLICNARLELESTNGRFAKFELFRNIKFCSGVMDASMSSEYNVFWGVDGNELSMQLCDVDLSCDFEVSVIVENDSPNQFEYLSLFSTIKNHEFEDFNLEPDAHDLVIITYDDLRSRPSYRKNIATVELVQDVYQLHFPDFCYLKKRDGDLTKTHSCEVIEEDDGKQDFVVVTYETSDCSGVERQHFVHNHYQDWFCGRSLLKFFGEYKAKKYVLSIIGMCMLVGISLFVVCFVGYVVVRARNRDREGKGKGKGYKRLKNIITSKEEPEEFAGEIERLGIVAKKIKEMENNVEKKRKKMEERKKNFAIPATPNSADREEKRLHMRLTMAQKTSAKKRVGKKRRRRAMETGKVSERLKELGFE